MIAIHVLYPLDEGTRFDMDYYLGSHVPLVRELLEPAGMRSIRILRAGDDADYGVIAELLFDDMESLSTALAEHGPRTQDDIPNFTDCSPVIQISEEIYQA